MIDPGPLWSASTGVSRNSAAARARPSAGPLPSRAGPTSADGSCSSPSAPCRPCSTGLGPPPSTKPPLHRGGQGRPAGPARLARGDSGRPRRCGPHRGVRARSRGRRPLGGPRLSAGPSRRHGSLPPTGQGGGGGAVRGQGRAEGRGWRGSTSPAPVGAGADPVAAARMRNGVVTPKHGASEPECGRGPGLHRLPPLLRVHGRRRRSGSARPGSPQ